MAFYFYSMLGRIKFLLLYFFSWVLLFEAARVLFLIYNAGQSSQLSSGTKANILLYGLRMDLSMASYILLPICAFVILADFIRFFQKTLVYKIYSYVVLFFVLLIVLSDLEIYRSWGFRVDATPLQYLASPKEAFASISQLPLFLIFVIFFAVYIGFCFLFGRLIRRIIIFIRPASKRIVTTAVIVIFTLLLVIPIRGGFQLTPLNQSSVYFSNDNFANISAVNATWNFMYGLTENFSTKNPYNYMDIRNAKLVTDSLFASSGQRRSMLRSTRPNIIVVVWESFTEKATRAEIEGKPITPRFNELKKEGIYFSRVTASGDRTDKGIVAVLSGYPALNNYSIIKWPSKAAKLNTLGGMFKKLGYHNSFYYGGEPEFANIKSYVLQGQYDALIDKHSFSSKDQNSKWGAHDGVVANRIFEDMNKASQPFFTTWLTLSSHEPFETPVPPVFAGKDLTSLFANSLHYTDQVLYDFVQRCKAQPWWDNTLMVVIADHGHPLISPSYTLENIKIPMLWIGGALKEKGLVFDKVCSQTDLATTLSKQVDPALQLFPFSKDIFDSTSKQWAYWSYNHGFALVQPIKSLVFDNVGKRIAIRRPGINAKDVEAGQALQEYIYQDFLNK
jgi:phosphoglycerol transferase MdoB-like AlkP superfamily enzyme